MKKITGYILLTLFSLTITTTVTMAQMRDTRSPAEKAFEFAGMEVQQTGRGKNEG